MYVDRRLLSDRRAMSIALAFENGRGATVSNVSRGRDPMLRQAVKDLGGTVPHVASADYLSELDGERRIIEVKGRGSSGPISVIERELDTFNSAEASAWLYVVWNTTQPHPYRLIVVRDPQQLPWVKVREAEREPGSFRGTRHEAQFQCQSEDIERLGLEVDLSGLELPEK